MARTPAVAGTFYPGNKEELRKAVKRFLEESVSQKYSGELKALIVPHAGYVYSGIVAGAGFKLVKDKKYKRVILLGPSHQVYFDKAALATEDFLTPLGIVKVGNTKEWLKEELIVELKEAHFQEHCLEVELPFLQETLGNFELFALVLGDVEEEKLARTIQKFVDEDTLVVVSSDLSHYLRYETAMKKDKETMNKILNFDFSPLDACGEKPIKVLMHLANNLDWKPFLIDYRNSGDTAGDKSRVVGYASLAFAEEEYE